MAITARQASAETRRFTYKGETRQVIIDAPAAANALPAIILLHGGAGTPRQIRRFVDLDTASRGWVLIVPEGLSRRWNDGRIGRGGAPLGTRDDAGFLASLIGTLSEQGVIDPRNVFIAGISNGGFMIQRMLCDYPGLLAAAAVLKAGYPVGLECDTPAATPLMFFNGTQDGFVPFSGGPIKPGNKDRGRTLSAGQTLRKWARTNRCDSKRQNRLPDTAPDDGTRILQITYTGCKAPLLQFIIEGGGHGWPGKSGARLISRILGPATRDIDANTVMLDFFGQNIR